MKTKITKRKIWSRDDRTISCNRFYISLLSFTIALLVLASPVLLQIVVPEFGPLVSIILVVSFVVVILFVRRSGFNFAYFGKYGNQVK